MSDDLTARLRRLYVQNGTNYVQEAADAIERLTAERDALRKMLLEAADEIESWGSYASDYFQNKHDLRGTVKRVRDAVRKENSDE